MKRKFVKIDRAQCFLSLFSVCDNVRVDANVMDLCVSPRILDGHYSWLIAKVAIVFVQDGVNFEWRADYGNASS